MQPATAPVNLSPAMLMELNKLINAAQSATAATLASALIAASGRAHSVNEAVELMYSVERTLRPNPGMGSYDQWKKTFDGNKAHV